MNPIQFEKNGLANVENYAQEIPINSRSKYSRIQLKPLLNHFCKHFQIKISSFLKISGSKTGIASSLIS